MARTAGKRRRCDACDAPARGFKHLRSEDDVDSWTTVCNDCFKKRRLVTVRQALDAGFPLCAQRRVTGKVLTMTKAFLCESIFPLDSLEANADARDCVQARRDAAALTGDARRAKAAWRRLEAALKQTDGLLAGPHVELVKRGTVDDATGLALHDGYRQACAAFREMRSVIRTECVVRKGETADAALLPFWLRTVGLWAQDALVFAARDITMGDVAHGAVLERVRHGTHSGLSHDAQLAGVVLRRATRARTAAERARAVLDTGPASVRVHARHVRFGSDAAPALLQAPWGRSWQRVCEGGDAARHGGRKRRGSRRQAARIGDMGKVVSLSASYITTRLRRFFLRLHPVRRAAHAGQRRLHGCQLRG